MNFCPHCHSGNDPVLSQLIWSCGNTMNDPQWRTKECYRRNLELANEHIKRLEEAGDALSKTQTYDLLENVNWRKTKEAKP